MLLVLFSIKEYKPQSPELFVKFAHREKQKKILSLNQVAIK